MALVIHRGKYVYDHHRVGNQVKCTYIGTTSEISAQPKIKISEEQPLLKHKDYQEAHNQTDRDEKNEYGEKRFNQLEKHMDKVLPDDELAGVHNGKSIVSERIDKDYQGEVLFHEQREKEIMKDTSYGKKYDGGHRHDKGDPEGLHDHPQYEHTGAKGYYGAKMTGKQKFRRVMREYKEGKLKSSSGEKVTNDKQAQAIAFSEARKVDPDYGNY